MKSVLPLVTVLFLTVGLFAQSKPERHASDNSIEHKHPPRVNRVPDVRPMEVLNQIEANMVNIASGSCVMGCTEEQDSDCYFWESPAHVITISSFYLSKYPVTQKQWTAVVGPNPYSFKECADCPVENVSWYDAQVFINKLNQMTGLSYRLPTEAEWEFAARGGVKNAGHKYPGSDDGNKVSWNSSNSGRETHAVGKKKPNELGLYDMSGNVWEWCSDWFSERYYTAARAYNPSGPAKAEYRVVRGGSWWSDVTEGRVANRDRYPADARDDDVGFRIARD